MIKVQLHQLKFHSFHGIHEEEKIIGNNYTIDASVEFQEHTPVITSIHETINYAVIYSIIKSRMEIPTPLLETILMEVSNEIQQRFPQLRSINISIQKMHPPIEGIQGSAIVSYQKEF
ncbi:MAG: dihydroneopterin aldolase [Ginsengibacter sp.]